MTKKKYKFNPDTLSYESVGLGWKAKALKIFTYFIVVALLQFSKNIFYLIKIFCKQFVLGKQTFVFAHKAFGARCVVKV